MRQEVYVHNTHTPAASCRRSIEPPSVTSLSFPHVSLSFSLSVSFLHPFLSFCQTNLFCRKKDPSRTCYRLSSLLALRAIVLRPPRFSQRKERCYSRLSEAAGHILMGLSRRRRSCTFAFLLLFVNFPSSEARGGRGVGVVRF